MLEVGGWESDLSDWLEPFLEVLGHAARRRWAPIYLRGLFGRTERKSIQPMAADLTPDDYDQLHNFIASRSWDSAALETVLAGKADALVGGPDAVLIVDDVALPKKGDHSVGVAHQYCGALGKQATCQVLVSLTLARAEVPIPVALRLFLPDDWAGDAMRCRRAGVPEEWACARTKPAIALAELDRLRGLGVRFGTVLADAGYGNGAAFRKGLSDRHLSWVVGVQSNQSVYDMAVRETWPTATRGRPRKRGVASEKPVAARSFLETASWQRFTWRIGTKGPLAAEFAAVRVRVADGPPQGNRTPLPGDEVWLIGERRDNGDAKYYLSNLPPNTTLPVLAARTKARWVCEQGHQQMKEELGLDHFEGRGWHGLHHHTVLVMIALAFLQHQRLATAPEGKKNERRRPRAASTADASRHPSGHSRTNPDYRTRSMSVLSVLARPAQARVELPK